MAPVEIVLTEHSLVRFQERLRPGLTLAAVQSQLEQLIREHGAVVSERPAWAAVSVSSPIGRYLVVGDDLAFLLDQEINGPGLIAVTCLCRGGLSSADRRHRSERKRERRAQMRARRLPRRLVDGADPAAAEEAAWA
jgi:hypothetical protein